MLSRVIIKLYSVELIHTVEFFDNQVTGISISVGRIIFSIVVSLGFVHNLCHRCLKLLLVGLILQLLHKQQIRVR